MRWGLLLINIGTPESPTPGAVRRYLAEFLMDPDVVDIPGFWRWLLVHGVILRTRPKRVAEAYSKVWTSQGSPLAVTHNEFATKLSQALPNVIVRAPFRYGQPSVDKAVADFRSSGVDHVLVWPLYPQYSTAATESSLRWVRSKLAAGLPGALVREIKDFYERPEFVGASAKILRRRIEVFKPDHVILSFHGLPERQIRRISPPPCLESKTCCDQVGESNRFCYRAQCFATARAILSEAGWSSTRASVAFQSRLGRTPWIRPYTDQLYRELPASGARRVLVACPSFVADCLETLEEVAIRGRESFLEAGGEELELVPCVNADPEWVKASSSWIATEISEGVKQ